MATGTLVSVEEYLSTTYRPDCEYLDGIILERNLGEFDHGRLQALLAAYFVNREKQWRVRAITEQRVQVKETRFRVPDLCIILEPGPFEQIVRNPPFLCIEILSRDDTFDSMQERIDDYLTFGVSYVWVISPRSRRAYVYTAEGSREAKDGILRTENPELTVILPELFASLE
jgi:Uma2 family endonuclease